MIFEEEGGTMKCACAVAELFLKLREGGEARDHFFALSCDVPAFGVERRRH